MLAFDDNRLASMLFGQYGQNLALIERRLGVVADQRGNHVTIEGSRDACEQARRVLEGSMSSSSAAMSLPPAMSRARSGRRSRRARCSTSTRRAARAEPSRKSICASARCARAPPRRTPISARCKRHALVFGIGPAGTGKTWLAVAHAVLLFERKEVDRIILSRPAVEAGERLGFLPGDMREKVDPYLRPIYDALYDLMDARIVERALQTGEIEIAPLAFMRGRTLSNAVVILDEAQNTTSMQMKMFLTRLGENSRMIVTGDPSQVDLPPGQTSGLAEAVRLLADVEGIGHASSRQRMSSATNSWGGSSRPTTAARSRARDRNDAVRREDRSEPAIDIRARNRRAGTDERWTPRRLRRRAIARGGSTAARQPCGTELSCCRRCQSAGLNHDGAARTADQRAVFSGAAAGRAGEVALGDIVIAYETVAREAGDKASRNEITCPIWWCMDFCIC